MTHLVYLITRDDGNLYVGTTRQNRIKQRMYQHSRHKRFRNHTFLYSILYETDCIEDCYDKEEFFIEKYDTYRNGLNESINGRGKNLSRNFTTRGTTLSEERKQHLRSVRLKAISEGTFTMPKNNWSSDQRQKMSERRRGRVFSSKITQEIADSIRTLYMSKPHLDIPSKSPNGIIPSYEWVFCKAYCNQYGITAANMKRIITNQTWNGSVHWSQNAKAE